MNHEILRKVSCLYSRLPVLDSNKFESEFYAVSVHCVISWLTILLQQTNDVMLMSYLATITKGCNTASEVSQYHCSILVCYTHYYHSIYRRSTLYMTIMGLAEELVDYSFKWIIWTKTFLSDFIIVMIGVQVYVYMKNRVHPSLLTWTTSSFFICLGIL